ncbi:MAG: [acyl-carrier-protein] S-malonyltransferase [Actinomycetota bacterium]|nr:[acyl-carrier-protein] S-malonyltransferase [Actinomycetota bacterium]
MLALLAPGQGAQVPGFLAPWLELAGVADAVTWWSAVLDLDLAHLGTLADADEIKDTAVAQPLLVGAGLAAASVLFPDGQGQFGETTPLTQFDDVASNVAAVAGHSVGEITAAALAGVLTPESALVFVRERGRAMARAAATTPTGMTALLGGDPQAVLDKLAELGLTAANVNAAGQVVAAGTAEQLAALAADPPEGARLRPLAVAGAFHTEHMAPAVDRLRQLAAGIPAFEPGTRLLSNADGRVIQHGKEFIERLVAQVAAPVRWDACMKTLGDLGVTAIIELPPAGTLTALVKRALPEVETLALKTPDDLDAARELIEKHRHDIEFTATPSWRLLVAPLAGTFEAGGATLGESLVPGAVLGRVVTRREAQEVVAVHGGTLVEWLVENGDPVSPGQPLARLHPEVVSA